MSASALIRADGDGAIGLGHLVRCTALAQELVDEGWRVQFAANASACSLLEPLTRERVELTRLTEAERGPAGLRRLVSEVRPDWVVLDGYQFSVEMERAASKEGALVAALDDGVRARHEVDLLLDQNLGARGDAYRVPAHCRMLLGPPHVLLRREFLRSRRRVQRASARRVLITMGGADPENWTLETLKALDAVGRDLFVRAVVTSLHPAVESLRRAASSSRHHIDIRQEPRSMAREMAWADLAVTAGGSTVWELFRIGIPAVIGITSDNQARTARTLSDSGAAELLGEMRGVDGLKIAEVVERLLASPRSRQALADRANILVAERPEGQRLGQAMKAALSSLRNGSSRGTRS